MRCNRVWVGSWRAALAEQVILRDIVKLTTIWGAGFSFHNSLFFVASFSSVPSLEWERNMYPSYPRKSLGGS